ncbi:MAG: SDR family oxidoreductase [Pseudomonadota bacterium]
MGTLTGQVAFVTGASRGIGAATALELAREGAAVILAARDEAACQTHASAIKQAGGQALAIACNVADRAVVEESITVATQTLGAPTILINNAGVIDPVSHLCNADPDAWTKVIDINVNGVFYAMRAVMPAMIAAGAGTIVNISSGAATSALEGWSHYCASKAAVLQLTRTAHKEAGPKGVRVVGLSPGTVATDMQRVIKASGVNPVSQLNWDDHIPPEWPAKAIAYLCTPAADDLLGDDVSLRNEDIRRRVGLI